MNDGLKLDRDELSYILAGLRSIRYDHDLFSKAKHKDLLRKVGDFFMSGKATVQKEERSLLDVREAAYIVHCINQDWVRVKEVQKDNFSPDWHLRLRQKIEPFFDTPLSEEDVTLTSDEISFLLTMLHETWIRIDAECGRDGEVLDSKSFVSIQKKLEFMRRPPK